MLTEHSCAYAYALIIKKCYNQSSYHFPLAHIILDIIEIMEGDCHIMELILNNIDQSVILTVEEDETNKIVFEKFEKAFQFLGTEGQW